VRVDFDDRGETFQSKIRNAEKEWIPFVCIIGDKEVKSGELSVRIRTSGKQETMTLQHLIALTAKETQGKPFERLSLAQHLSKRPVF